MPSLTIRTGSRSGEVVTFERTIVIGRGTADVVLEDSTVSRRHAEFNWSGGRCTVTDLHTGNGTFVNGRRISTPTALTDGDELWLGRVVVGYTSRHAAASGAEAGPSDAGRRAAETAAQPPSVALVEERASPSIVMAIDAKAPAAAPDTDAARVIAQLTQRMDAFNEIGADLAQTFDELVLFGKVMDRLFELLPQAERGMLVLQDDGGELVPKIARTRAGSATHIAASRTLIREVISQRKGILSLDAQGDERFRAAESLIGLGVRTLVCVPMLAYDEVYGVIQLDSTRGTLPFSAADVALAFAIARQLAMALANARLHRQMLDQELFQRDLALARSIQRHFLPRRTPDIPGRCFAVEYAPALAVGGDYYDFLRLPDGRIGLAIGDVSGKGVSAALYVAKLGSELRYAAAAESQPSQILARVNAALVTDNEEAMFVTLLLAVLDPATGELRMANAGHLQPALRQAGGGVSLLETPAQSPLAVREDASFEQTTHVMGQRDVLVLYSDGVTEATSRSRELFGEERLLAAVAAAAGTAEGTCSGILSAVRSFLDGEPQNDDITILTIGGC